MKKKQIQILKLIFILYIGSWLDDTTQLESLNEDKNELSLEKKSWYDYLYENKYKILGISLIIIIPFLFFNINPNFSEKPFPFPEAPVSNIDLLLTSLQPNILDTLFNDFLTTISYIMDKSISKEEGISILLKIMKLKKFKTLVFNEEEFEQITKKLIEEIEKI
jgi:hypothetical protein